ncbi:hypothetical protein ACX1C1_19630 [Paenibacillus sp. strain BS8-2]
MSITTDGFTYQNHTGENMFVDFESCRHNFTKWLQIENNLTEEERSKVEVQTRCVAIRDAFEDPKYIEFLSEPRIRIEFKKKLFKGEYKEFREFVLKINEVGWKIFDMG